MIALGGAEDETSHPHFEGILGVAKKTFLSLEILEMDLRKVQCKKDQRPRYNVAEVGRRCLDSETIGVRSWVRLLGSVKIFTIRMALLTAPGGELGHTVCCLHRNGLSLLCTGGWTTVWVFCELRRNRSRSELSEWMERGYGKGGGGGVGVAVPGT